MADEIRGDITKACIDCNEEFTLVMGEQRFYADKGYELPKRCDKCRAIKKKKNEERSKGLRDAMSGEEDETTLI